MRRVVNFLLFQIGWFACVLSAARGLVWVGPLTVVLLLGIHFLVVRQRRNELLLLLMVGAFGTVLDTAIANFGVIRYEATAVTWLCPPWIIAIWFLFAATFNHSFSWLSGRLVLAFFLGAIGGPLSYAAGGRMGALAFSPETSWAIGVSSAIWSVALPLCVGFATWLRARDSVCDEAAEIGAQK